MSKVMKLREVRLMLGAGAAKPGPAIGQALGPLGINMAEFCKQFNDKTKTYEKDVPVPVVLSAFSNRTFTFITKTPTTSWLLKRCAGLEKGAAKAGHEEVGYVHVKQVYEIAKVKQSDDHLKALPLLTLSRMIMATARSMGIKIVDDKLAAMVSKQLADKAKAEAAEVTEGKGKPEAAKAVKAKAPVAKPPASASVGSPAASGDKKAAASEGGNDSSKDGSKTEKKSKK